MDRLFFRTRSHVKNFQRGLLSAAFSTLVALTSTSLPAWASSGSTTIVTIKLSKDRHELKQLAHDGYDIAGVDLERGTVDIVVQQATYNLGKQFQGYSVAAVKGVDTSLLPDSGYNTPAELEALLRQYAASYPNITRLESIGRSREGRDIWALKITDNPDRRETDEPTVLFDGMHHAREVMSAEVPLDTINYLLTNYGVLNKVTEWVDSSEIWVVPMVNPDGNNKVWTGNTMWRKNAFAGYGVDINRNYPYGWNSCQGSSGMTFAQDYRGPTPASEPETRAMMDFVARIQPVFGISYHSYSELVLFPYGCENQRTPTREVVEPIGRQMAGLLPKDAGRSTYDVGTPWELLYNADGTSMDWMYNAYNVIAYAIEINGADSGFQPPYSKRQPTVEKLRAGWGLILDKLSGSGVRGLVTSAGHATPTATVTAHSMTAFPMPESMTDTTWRVKADGTYHLVLLPGTYHLIFTADGRNVERDVTIGDDRVEMDVEL